MPLADYAEDLLANYFFKNGAISRPASWWVALHTAAPDEDASPSNEVVGVNYARVGAGNLSVGWA